MFGALKEKIKNWIKKSKEKVEESAEVEKELVEEKEEDTKKKEEAKKEKKKETKIKKEEKIKEREIIVEEKPKLEQEEADTAIEIETELEEGITEEDEKAIEKIEEEMKEAKGEEAPVKYDVAKHKYEPDVEKIKEEAGTKKESSFFKRIRSSFKYKIAREEFDEIFEDLEMLLLENNVALEAVEDIKKKLSDKLIGREIKKENLEMEIRKELKACLNEILIEPDDPAEAINFKKKQKKPFVILFFGINGTGKTTSIAKLAYLLKQKGFSVVLAAGDTFRAASIEQISIHADKLKVPLIKHDYGADPAAVGFDAIKYAEKHKIDVVLIDSAGRMHTKTNLLNEMGKICRVTNPDLKIFVAESIAGNDATEQAKSFNEIAEIDGAILTKADVDEKGGTVISVSHAIHKPIFYLGVGQEYKDLQLFNKDKFIGSLGL